MKRLLPLALALAAVGAVLDRPAAAQAPRPLRLEPCTLPGSTETLRCGTYTVFEDRAARTGRTIDLRVVVAPSRSPTPAADAVWMLAGGPGQGAAELAPLLLAQLEGLRANRDVVLMDQRGTGGSNPLGCPGGFGVLEPGRLAELRACRAGLERRADLRHYTTAPSVDDMDEVRAALGYRQVTLVGASYGTRAAQVYMRRHPASVRAAVLRATLPLGGNILVDGSLTADRELRAVVRDCEADAACAAAFPRLRAELDTVLAQLAARPQRIRIAGAGGDTSEVEVTHGLFFQTLFALMLSAPTRQMLPLVVHRAATGRLQEMAAVIGQIRAASYGTVPVGMYLSIVCAEDEPRIGRADRARLRALAGGESTGIHQACSAWARGAVPASFHEPLRTRIPVLLLSGAADPATAAAPTEAWARTLPHALHVVFPATTHGPFFPGCGAALVARFVETASIAGLDGACAAGLRWPPFVTPPAATR